MAVGDLNEHCRDLGKRAASVPLTRLTRSSLVFSSAIRTLVISPKPEAVLLFQVLDLLLQVWQPERHQVKIFEAEPFAFFRRQMELLQGNLCLTLTHCHFVKDLV